MKKEVNIDLILASICRYAEKLFADKLYKIILYGSYASGNFDDESDVDVMIVVDMDDADLCRYETLFTEFSSDASMENEVLIVPLLFSKTRFEAQMQYVPFIQNVNAVGRLVYA